MSSLRSDVLDWLEEARADLVRAERALRDEDYSLSCFLSQQAVEKALKAASIALARTRPPHFHDLTALYEPLRGLLSLPEDLVEALPELSQYYVTARYPNAGLRRPSVSFSRSQAARAMEAAKRVVEAVEDAVRAREGGQGPGHVRGES